jgi:hypothetical protein
MNVDNDDANLAASQTQLADSEGDDEDDEEEEEDEEE